MGCGLFWEMTNLFVKLCKTSGRVKQGIRSEEEQKGVIEGCRDHGRTQEMVIKVQSHREVIQQEA